jgi:hypothetical protein
MIQQDASKRNEVTKDIAEAIVNSDRFNEMVLDYIDVDDLNEDEAMRTKDAVCLEISNLLKEYYA